MLTTPLIEEVLARAPRLTFGVLGDLFLDRYLEIDPALTEVSLETGLDAYQVVRVRSDPGAAGTVINNLAALGAGRIRAFAVVGDDGEGYELGQALERLGVVDRSGIVVANEWRTPTYTKPLVCQAGAAPRELHRLDIKNQHPLPPEYEGRLLEALTGAWPELDVLLVLDQIGGAGHGVVTSRVLDRLAGLGKSGAQPLLADSRDRIEVFRSAWLKPNRTECLRAVGAAPSLEAAVTALAGQAGRPVFCTCGEEGIVLADPRADRPRLVRVPAYPVAGPVDIVGAGDSTSAGIACAIAAGIDPVQAAAFGNLVASITIQQIGRTGTATPEQVRDRWREVRSEASNAER